MLKCLLILVILSTDQCLSESPNSSYISEPISSGEKTRVRRLAGVPKPEWHVAVFVKDDSSWRYKCAGSVVRPDVVISVAHCFWNRTQIMGGAGDQFAVGGNKNFKDWDDPNDRQAQKIQVIDIVFPPAYRDVKGDLQSDISVLRLATPFQYTKGLRPVCVDFGEAFERQQLKDGNRGTIAGWGSTDATGRETQRLLWLEQPYVDTERCVESLSKQIRPSTVVLVTWDKFCAGDSRSGKALCIGDSGGGLVFWRGRAGGAAPFLRGVASAAPGVRDFGACNQFAVTAYTRLSSHRAFLREQVPGIDRDCQYKG